MHKQRIAVLGLALLAIVGSLGPWITVPMLNLTVDGSAGDGWLAVGCLVVVVLMAILGGFSKSFGMVSWGIQLVFAALAVVIGAYTVYNVLDRLSGAPAGVWSMGWGLPLLIIAAALIPVAGFALKDRPAAA